MSSRKRCLCKIIFCLLFQETDQREDGEPPSVAQGLLDDYVSLGLLDGPRTESPSDVGEANAPPPELPRVPWLGALDGISSPLLRLHQEIVEFGRFVAPSPEEAAARNDSIARIQAVVQSIWPSATVEVFGSFATGLYLPTSDLDAVILNSGCTNIPSGLKALANALTRRSLAKNLQLIAKARVPIVKFEEAESGYLFDISFDVANGPEAAANVRALMDTLPPMRLLVTVIKVFLQQRELNEVYSGGLGSYAVLVMVASFLQMHPSRGYKGGSKSSSKSDRKGNKNNQPRDTLESNLGVLLVDFLRLYGRALSHTSVGVSCRKGGGYFSKRNKGFLVEERHYLLAIEDPNDPENDLGKNSFNASRARAAFDYAYCRLKAPSREGESLLHRIIRLDPALFLREPKAHPVEPEKKVEKKVEKRKGEKKAEERNREVEVSQGKSGRDDHEEESRGKIKKNSKKRRHRERSASDDDSWGDRRGGKREKKDNGSQRGGRGHVSRSEQHQQPRRDRGKGGWRRGGNRHDRR